ncbi:MAG: hypothetical protein IPI67_06070 [Myxococcales bacterium]|nr:hypothetical protein [Myxococcales bacterium]
MRRIVRAVSLLLVPGLATALAVACASGEDVTGGGGKGGTDAGATGGTGGTGAGDSGTAATGGTGGSGGTGAQDGGSGASDSGSDAGSDAGGECSGSDEQNCYSGTPGTDGVGECKAGKQKCQAGQWGACEGEVVPATAETCDSKDNDCNGLVDEALGQTTCGKGVCQVTVENCVKGVPQTCTPKTGSATEKCDGVDDNCDGNIDEGCSCQDGKTQTCYSGPSATEGVGLCKSGLQTCTGGKWGTCQGEVVPTTEICDGKDNNCNNQDDENNPGGGATCSTGLSGVCSLGAQTCKNGKLECVAVTQPGSETCDGQDNDCDGKIDNGGNLCGGACTLSNTPNTACDGPDTDLCAEGQWTCNGLNAVTCSDTTGNSVEICNGVDDNCDGKIDEGNNACGGVCTLSGVLGAGCDGPDTDLCAEGQLVCNGLNGLSCTDNTGNNVETCNGADDNCDGKIDEGSNSCGGACTLSKSPGTPCDGSDTDLCNEGQWQCNGMNAVTCSDNTGNNVEICDSIDQDCDGNVDEGPCSLPNASSTCSGGGCVVTSCNSGYSDCNANPGCETKHSGSSNSAPGQLLGTWDADACSGFVCGCSGCVNEASLTKTGTQGQFFTITANEASSCSAYVSVRFELTVPTGVNYDLYVTGTGCFSDPVGFYSASPGNDIITIWCDDSSGSDDSFTANVEVRYSSGRSCSPWTLKVYRRQC